MPDATFDPFDPAGLALSPEQLDGIAVTKVKLARRPRAEPFLYRVPMAWAYAAGRLRHHAWDVGTLLWFEAGRRKTRTITFCLARGEAMGLSEDTTRRALHRLEAAGLVSITRKAGRGLEVTILDGNGETGHDQ